MVRIAVLDDWQNVARESADWTRLLARAEVDFYDHPFADVAEAASRLAGYEILLPLRERTAFPAELIEQLPRLRLVAMTGPRAGTLDLAACTAHGVLVCNTGSQSSGAATAELALGLLLAASRRIPAGDAAIRAGRFHEGVGLGRVLAGQTLGIIGLGRIGTRMAGYGRALGMRVLAWSPNLTPERAAAAGAEFAEKDKLLAAADAISLHLVLSPRTERIIAAADLACLKPGAIVVNTARGGLIEEAALIAAVTTGKIIAALDVFNSEPLPAGHPLRRAANAVLTPHLGFATREIFVQFYTEAIENILAFLDGAPIRMLNPEALGRGA
jgi:phosphoglycerate dehydrogenase-like enzyme